MGVVIGNLLCSTLKFMEEKHLHYAKLLLSIAFSGIYILGNLSRVRMTICFFILIME